MKWSAGVLLVGLGLAGGDSFPSGPAVGEKLKEFKVQGFSGPQEGKEFEVLGQVKGAPSLVIFVHQITRPALQLLRPVDAYAAKLADDKLATHIIWLSEDKNKTEEFLKRAKDSLNLQSPVSISLDGKDGPPAFGLNDKVTLTILLAKDNKVVANFALADPNATDAPKVIAAMAKLMGKTPPKLEDKKPARPAKDEVAPELQKLMRQMIQKDNDEATVQRLGEALKKWAGDDAPKRTQLRDYCRRVIDLGYGNETAQKALKKLAAE